jgi:hypothetical protein
VADDAVCCELLSASNSLIIWEDTGNFRDVGRLEADLRPKKPSLLSLFCPNSLLNRTGNFEERTGKYFAGTGNSLRTSGNPLSCLFDRPAKAIT